jgi:hypothetical protein
MATRTGVAADTLDGLTTLITWAGLTQASADVGDGAMTNKYPERTVQAIGTFGVGGSMALQGSNDGTNWGALKDAYGVLIALTTSVPVAIGDNPLFIRPAITAGDGTTNLSCLVAARKWGT